MTNLVSCFYWADLACPSADVKAYVLCHLLKCRYVCLQDSAEFGRIGRYYATESMLVWDDIQKKYIADATPSYGKVSLEQFFERAMKEGLAGQELGDAAIF